MWKCDHLEPASKYNSPTSTWVDVPVGCVRVSQQIVYFLLLVDGTDLPRGGRGLETAKWRVGGFDS